MYAACSKTLTFSNQAKIFIIEGYAKWMTYKAIILAAGRGKRLRGLTDNIPKPFVEVAEKPIILRALDNLSEFSSCVDEVVIVIGYRGEIFVERIGNSYRNLKIVYVENPVWYRTNNIYSLWMARKHMDRDVLLIEGDIVFRREVIDRLLQITYRDVVVVGEYEKELQGACVTLKGGVVEKFILSSEQGADFDKRGKFITANIYKLSKNFIKRHFIPEMERLIETGGENLFYEVAIKRLIERGQVNLHALVEDNRVWVEIDTISDLKRAERMVKW